MSIIGCPLRGVPLNNNFCTCYKHETFAQGRNREIKLKAVLAQNAAGICICSIFARQGS